MNLNQVIIMEESKSGLNTNLVFTTFVVIMGNSFLFGYNFAVLNQPSTLIKEFFNSTYRERNGEDSFSESTLTITWSLANALYIPGGMIGVFFGGWLSDHVGRKRTIIISQIFIFIGSALACSCVAAKSPEILLVGRFIHGIHAGISTCIAPMFVTEIAPINLRGAFGTVHQLFIVTGMFIAAVLGLKEVLGTETLWPYLTLLEILPAGFSVIVFIFLPDTPRYLLLVKNDKESARNALKFYHKTEDVFDEMEEMGKEHHQEVEGENQSFLMKQLFTTRELRRPLMIACMLQLAQQFSGCCAVIFYSSSIYAQANVHLDHIQYAIIGTNGVLVIATVVAVPLMDKLGRRPLLILPMIVMTVCLILMTICQIVQSKNPSLQALSYVTVACIIVYIIAIAVGLGPIPGMIAAELFRQGPRPKAMAVSCFVNWLSVFVIAMGFESLQAFAKDYTFVIFIILMTIFTILTYIFVPETKNKTFEEIAHLFSPSRNKLDEIDLEKINSLPDIKSQKADDGQVKSELLKHESYDL